MMRISKASLLILAFGLLSAQTAIAQEVFVKELEDSPRHQEWVKVKHGDRSLDAFVVYPEVDHKVESVVVIHENRGLNDWVRTVADRLAEAGYIAIAPDLLSGMGPQGGGTSSFSNSDDARTALYKLDPEQITADLRATADFVRSLPAADGTVSVAGFCWGGSQTFRFATNYNTLQAVFVFYGTAPDSLSDLARIDAPVFGFYGGDDARVGATIEPTRARMQQLSKKYEPVTYEGAGHGFMRRGVSDGASEPDAAAADAAWLRWLKLLAE